MVVATLFLAGEIGSGAIKLGDWENLAEIHEAITLSEGRKQTASRSVFHNFQFALREFSCYLRQF